MIFLTVTNLEYKGKAVLKSSAIYFLIFISLLGMLLYISLKGSFKDSGSLLFENRKGCFDELVNEIKSDTTIREMKVLKGEEEYNTLNGEVFSEHSNLFDSLQVNKGRYNSLRSKMIELGIMQFACYGNSIKLYRIISMWGDEGWIYFYNDSSEDMETALQMFFKYEKINNNWYYWYDD